MTHRQFGFCALTFLLAATVGLLQAQQDNQSQTFREAWQSFRNNPSDQSALVLYRALPANPDSAHSFDLSQQKTLQSIYHNFEVIGSQILAGHRNAVKVAFRLLNVSDGDFAESIDITLGRLVKSNPRMFLQELNSYRTPADDFGGILCNLGEDYVDSIAAQIVELKARIKSLQRVPDADLQPMRERCIGILNEQIKTLQEP